VFVGLASALVAIGGVVFAAFPASAESSDGFFGPSRFTAPPLTYTKGDNPKSLAFGTPVSLSGPPSSSARNHLDSFQASQFIGNVGWAIANLGQSGNGFEYPLYSANHGKSWTTDGPYFHGPWADAPAWVGSLQAYSATFAVAYSQGGQTLYATDDGGRHWYSVLAFSSIVSVAHTMTTNRTSATGTIRVAVSKTGNAPAKYVFTSGDGGRKWVRHAAPHSPTESARASGYGLIVGDVRPCTAKRFDAQPDEPLIVIATRNNKTYVTYNVSADPGTTWYHFDVPTGHYTLSTTWWGSKDYNVLVQFGKTSKVNMDVSCATFST